MTNRCHYCQRPVKGPSLRQRMIVPRSQGGFRTLWNLVTTCTRCESNGLRQCPCDRCQHAYKRITGGSMDEVRCHYCGTDRGCFNVDHIVPRRLGGNEWSWNKVIACVPCNQAKADKIPTCRCPKCLYAITRQAPTMLARAQNGGRP